MDSNPFLTETPHIAYLTPSNAVTFVRFSKENFERMFSFLEP
jgi:hypothetical protein